MAAPKASGRMIRAAVAASEKVASLSPEAAVLFLMLIPHFNAHGKMAAGPGVIKDEVVPLVPYLTYENLPGYLQEISDKTNVKWFRVGAKWWLHSLHFLEEHQDLRVERLGPDELPSWVAPDSEHSGSSPGVVRECSGSAPGVVPDSPSRAEGLKGRRGEEGQNQSAVGEGGGEEPRASAPPSPAPVRQPVDGDQVNGLVQRHLTCCGLSSMPPVDLFRELLGRGHPLQAIVDVYQLHGGDVMRYRQRNIVESLTGLRDGARASPRGVGKRDKGSAAGDRAARSLAAAQDFARGGETC